MNALMKPIRSLTDVSGLEFCIRLPNQPCCFLDSLVITIQRGHLEEPSTHLTECKMQYMGSGIGMARLVIPTSSRDS